MKLQAVTDSYTMPNGVKIPCVGFGTWQTPDDETGVAAVKAALACGYRHIDTAAVYQNEKSVGEGIRQSGVPRADIFLTTKLWNAVGTYDEAIAAFEGSLAALQTDYVDLYLIHWPRPGMFHDTWEARNAAVWRAMETVQAQGRARAIGVSNFLPHHLDALAKTAQTAPQVNQIRLCPGFVQAETTAYCKEKGMVVEAYSPMGTGKIFGDPTMQALAAKYGRSVAQICVRWSLENGFLPLPKSVHADRICENAQVFDFALEQADIDLIASLTDSCGAGNDPDNISW